MVITPDRQPYIQPISREWYQSKVAEIAVLRLDVVHKDVSGNKWYKLRYNIQHCIDNNIDTILSFGGGYSNHLAATAAMAKLAGLKSVGVVRGNYPQLTTTLQFCIDNGMQLRAVAHEEYKRKNSEEMLGRFAEQFPGAFIIPEGGANHLGREGTKDIAGMIPSGYTHVAVSVGTGTTLAGLANALPIGTKVAGFAPMKGGAYLNEEVSEWIEDDKKSSYHIYDNWHFGGFGKHTDELLHFMNDFHKEENIPLDKVYTAKMMFGIRQQVLDGVYPADARILCIHTGGLQGNKSVGTQLGF